MVQGGVAEHLEGSRQHRLAHHVLERLSPLFQAMTLKPVTENLVEEHATGRA